MGEQDVKTPRASSRKCLAITGTLLCGLGITLSGYGADVPKKGTIDLTSLRGTWRGATNGMQCIVEFSRTNDLARIYSFKGEQHVSTLFDHYRISPGKDRVVFMLNGEASVLNEKQLLLKLRPANQRVLTVRDVILSKKNSDKD